MARRAPLQRDPRLDDRSEARLARKSNGTAAKLCYAGHLLMEHRNALIVDAELTAATGYAERDTAVEMLGRLPATKRRRTVAGDKGYDTADFVRRTPTARVHPARRTQHTNRRSAIDGRTTRHAGTSSVSGSANGSRNPSAGSRPIAGGRKLRYIGQARNRAWFKITTAVYNLIRITALLTSTTG